MNRIGLKRRQGTSTKAFLFKRIAVLFLLLLIALTLVFGYIHFGPHDPAEQTTEASDQGQLIDKKQTFGLYRPLWVQYGDYLHDMFTLDFGESWSSRHIQQDLRAEPITDVNTLLIRYGSETLWLWLWTFIFAVGVGVPLGVGLGFSGHTWSEPTATVGGALVRAVPVFVLALVFQQVLFQSERFLFGLNWQTLLVPTRITGPIPLSNLSNPAAFVAAFKHVAPAALALASAFIGTTIRLGQRVVWEHQRANYTDVARTKGVREGVIAVKHVGKNAVLPFVAILPISANILIGGTMVVEPIYQFDGLGVLMRDAATYMDYTTLQALLFLFILLLVVATFVRDVLYAVLTGPPDRHRKEKLSWTGLESSKQLRQPASNESLTLQSISRRTALENGMLDRILANPRPALVWLLGIGLLVAVEIGALADLVVTLSPWEPASVRGLARLPTLLSREAIPNAGYWTPASGWVGTFLGLPPAYAWALRVGTICLYAASWLGLMWGGYRLYRSYYRGADHTPTDAFFARFRRHRWGIIGFFVVFGFVVGTIFAPALGPTELSRAGPQPNTTTPVTYYDEQAGSVTTVSRTLANLNAEAGVGSYDRYGRFHPLGTTDGSDLLTELLWATRIQLYFMVLVAVLVGVALLVSLGATYRDGIVEDGMGFLAELVSVLPVFPAVSVVSAWMTVLFAESQRGDLYGPVPYWAIFVAVFSWPLMWRAIHSPTWRILNRSWLDAARSYGQRRGIIRKHVFKRVIGYAVVYLCMLMGGLFIFVGASQYFAPLRIALYFWAGLIDGISSSAGSGYIAAGALVLYVAGFIALADGVRDALDPDHTVGTNSDGESIGTGWGG